MLECDLPALSFLVTIKSELSSEIINSNNIEVIEVE